MLLLSLFFLDFSFFSTLGHKIKSIAVILKKSAMKRKYRTFAFMEDFLIETILAD
jgi:hypothetical protein